MPSNNNSPLAIIFFCANVQRNKTVALNIFQTYFEYNLLQMDFSLINIDYLIVKYKI